MGYVKEIPRCPEKSINLTNGTRILQSRSDRPVTDPKTFKHWKSRTLARQSRLADQNTSQWNILRRNLFVVYPGLQEGTDQLTHARNSQTTTAGADTAAGSKFPQKWDTAHVRRLHPAVAWNLTTWVGMFCDSGCYVWFISLFWPFSTDISAFCEFHWILYPLKSV